MFRCHLAKRRGGEGDSGQALSRKPLRQTNETGAVSQVFGTKKANEESFALVNIVDLDLAEGSTALTALGLDLRLRVEDGLVKSPGFILGNVAALLQALLGLGLGLLGGSLVDIAAVCSVVG